MTALQLAPQVWSDADRALVQRMDEALTKVGTSGGFQLRSVLAAQIGHVNGLGELLTHYPSLFQTQVLGAGSSAVHQRNAQTLVDRLSRSTPFTLDMQLPMRAITGKSYIMARVNFFRFLRRAIDLELAEYDVAEELYRDIDREISRSLFARVVEELLTSIVCDMRLDRELRHRAALGLTHLWEDRLHFPMREFFPVLEQTWEARRRIRVQYGTLGGATEMFSLMREGCDEEFIGYFSRDTCDPDEIAAFREFLFGLSTEELKAAEERRAAEGGVITADQIRSLRDVDELAVEEQADLATRLFTFFMKRHLEATARAIGNQPGPKRTAEEYVMLAFLKAHPPEVFGEHQ